MHHVGKPPDLYHSHIQAGHSTLYRNHENQFRKLHKIAYGVGGTGGVKGTVSRDGRGMLLCIFRKLLKMQ